MRCECDANSWRIEKPLDDDNTAFQNFCENVLKVPGRVCKTHVSAIPANNGTFKQRFKSQDAYKLLAGVAVQLRARGSQVAGFACATGSSRQHKEEVADWFSAWSRWYGPVKGRRMLGNGGYRLVTNNQGMESGLRRDRNAISGGGGERKESAGLAGFSCHLYRQHAEEPQARSKQTLR